MRGTYVLLARISHNTQLKIGKLGSLEFEGGLYAYVGSALKSLKNRVERHMRSEKSKHWHIDYFLTGAKVVEVIYGESGQRKECEIAGRLAEIFPSVGGFGSSDCKCRSHLFFSKDDDLEEEVITSFKKAGIPPARWQIEGGKK